MNKFSLDSVGLMRFSLYLSINMKEELKGRRHLWIFWLVIEP